MFQLVFIINSFMVLLLASMFFALASTKLVGASVFLVLAQGKMVLASTLQVLAKAKTALARGKNPCART